MLDRLQLPEASRQVYENSPLAAVICQVRFPRNLSVMNPPSTAKFQRAIQKRYPHLEEAHDAVISLNLSPSPSVAQTPVAKWQFSDPEKDWIVVLAQEYLGLEARKYDRFETFVERLQEALTALIRHIQPSGIVRIGLRYINEIRLSSVDPRTIIRPEPLGLIGVSTFTPHIRQSIREEIMDLGNGQVVQIRHGLIPGGSSVIPRADHDVSYEEGPFYLLDFDVSHTFAKPIFPDPKGNLVITKVGESHEVIHRLFHWFVTADYLERLRMVDDDDHDR